MYLLVVGSDVITTRPSPARASLLPVHAHKPRGVTFSKSDPTSSTSAEVHLLYDILPKSDPTSSTNAEVQLLYFILPLKL